VTEQGSGTPLAGICAQVFNDSADYVATDRTDAGGSYAVGGLGTGNYRLWFTDCGAGAFHLPEWYDAQSEFDLATDIPVTDGLETGGIDAELALGGGGISGTVIEVGGGPLDDACVAAIDTLGRLASASPTNAAGQYTVGGLNAGPYVISFADCHEPAAHVQEYYNNSLYYEHTNPVSVSNGAKTPNINAALAVGASINGHLSEQGGAPDLAGICVSAFGSSGLFRGGAETDAAGNYAIGGLPAGAHKVRFSDCESPEFHVIEWYNNASSFAIATPVMVGGPGTKTSGIGGALALGGSISGTVSEAVTGELLPDVCLEVYTEQEDFIFTAVTDISGEYEVGGLAEGRYKIVVYECVIHPTHVVKWWTNATSFAAATLVNVAPGVKTGSISPVLAEGGFINGTVTDRNDGHLLPWICVFGFDGAGDIRALDRADLSGKYRLVLPAGIFKVLFFDCREPSAYLPRWYNDQQFFDTANGISVGAPGSKTSGRNAALALDIPGDVDCGTSVTSVDALLILQLITGLAPPPECLLNADPSGDETITSVDALLILQFVAGLIPAL
jgi:hypothetical protein